MCKKPLVSILVPVYRVENFIQRCVVSLFEQDYDNIEYVFVDDHSPDESVNIIKEISKSYPERLNRVKILRHNRNLGLSAARNTAIDNACGEFLMHVDSDDYIEKTTITDVVNAIIINQADVVIFGARHIFKNKSKEIIDIIPESVEEYVNKIIRREVSICIWGALYKASLYKLYNIRAIEGISFGEDYAVKPRLISNAHKVIGLQKVYYNYVQYNNFSYTKNFSRGYVDSLLKAINVLNNFFVNISSSYKSSIEYAEARIKAEMLINWGICDGSKEDYEYICQSFNSPNNIKNELCMKYRITLMLEKRVTALKMFSKIGYKIKNLI